MNIDSEKLHSDVIDLLNDACQIPDVITHEDGTTEKVLILDTKKAWYKTHVVGSPTFGRMALELEMLENKAGQCFNNMSKARAEVMAKQILDIVIAYRYSVDAKSSESRRDKHNTQSTLIDRLLRYKIEKQYSVKDEAKKSMLSGMIGKDEDKENV